MADTHAGLRSGSLQDVSNPKGTRPLFRHVMACLTPSPDARRVLEHAVALADLSGAELTALHVLQRRPAATAPADPVDWSLARRDAIEWLQRLGDEVGAPEQAHLSVVDGPPAKCICHEAREAEVDLAVLGAREPGSPSSWGLGATARQVAENFPASVMLIPADLAHPSAESGRTPRILALLDGSPQAEAATSIAASIAARRGAELVLLHAVPTVGVAIGTPPAPEDQALYVELQQRAEHAAKAHLERIRRLIPATETRSSVRVLAGEDPRRALARAVLEEECDLVVLAARGIGNDPDLRIGSTAEYLISRSVTPTLLVRTPDGAAHHSAVTAPRRGPAVRGTG